MAAYRDAIDAILEAELPSLHKLLLVALSHHVGKRLSTSRIVAMTGMSRSTVQRTLEDLWRRGIVVSGDADRDGRLHTIRLPRGNQIVEPALYAEFLRDIKVQSIAGRYYLSGDTYAIKDQLRAAGCQWDSKRQAWWTCKRDVAERFSDDVELTTDAINALLAGNGCPAGLSHGHHGDTLRASGRHPRGVPVTPRRGRRRQVSASARPCDTGHGRAYHRDEQGQYLDEDGTVIADADGNPVADSG